jgi:hypothetical protein
VSKNKSIITEKQWVIIVSTVPMYPCTQGNRQVIRQLVCWLKKNGYKVIFIFQGAALGQFEQADHESMVDEFYQVKPAQRRLSVLAQKLKVLQKRLKIFGFTIKERNHNRVCLRETKDLVGHCINRRNIHAVIAQYHFMVGVFSVVPEGVLKIVQTHDACSRILERFRRTGVDTQGREISRRLERKRLKRADVVVAIERGEQVYFEASLGLKRVVQVGFASDFKGHHSAPKKRRGMILFYGSNNPLNREGIESFIEHSWPLIESRHEGAVLYVAGDICESLRTRGSAKISLLRRVDDLVPLIQEAEIIINPVWLGTGLKIKSVEAVSMGKALLATPEAAVGLVIEGKACPVRVAASEEDFRKGLSDLLLSPSKVAKLEENAVLYSREFLSLNYVYRPLQRVLEGD